MLPNVDRVMAFVEASVEQDYVHRKGIGACIARFRDIGNNYAIAPALVAFVADIILRKGAEAGSVFHCRRAVLRLLRNPDGRIADRRAIWIQVVHEGDEQLMIDGRYTLEFERPRCGQGRRLRRRRSWRQRFRANRMADLYRIAAFSEGAIRVGRLDRNDVCAGIVGARLIGNQRAVRGSFVACRTWIAFREGRVLRRW